MQIDRIVTMSAQEAPEPTFTGDIIIGGYFRRDPPSHLAGATVAFAPGARTPWKVNPLGQTLVVTNGVGWAQIEGEDTAEIRAGDLVWFPPGVRHWEGATPIRAMSYVALQETDGGTGVEFGRKVSDDEYSLGPPKR